jgi:NitT/TauT family transport system permease protein
MSDTFSRPEIVREISGADEFGIVEKELTIFERLYNLGWVRKTGLLILLALIWEGYARYLDNSLLVPTLTDTFQAWRE